MFISTCN